jgi:hypothetical protein
MAAPMPRVPPVTTATRAISSSLGWIGLAYWSMILFRPAFARRSIKRNDELYQGFAQAGNRYPPRIKCGAGFFGIMLSGRSPHWYF